MCGTGAGTGYCVVIPRTAESAVQTRGNPEEGYVELMHHRQLEPGSLDLAQFDRLAHMRSAINIHTTGFSGQKISHSKIALVATLLTHNKTTQGH